MTQNIKHKKIGLGKVLILNGFREAYISLPHKNMAPVRAAICEACYWTEPVFRTKMSGRSPFRIYEVEKIEELFRQYNIDAWTGEQLAGPQTKTPKP
jgi:hypothetical protein